LVVEPGLAAQGDEPLHRVSELADGFDVKVIEMALKREREQEKHKMRGRVSGPIKDGSSGKK
jgi:hypothetical protein